MQEVITTFTVSEHISTVLVKVYSKIYFLTPRDSLKVTTRNAIDVNIQDVRKVSISPLIALIL